RRGSGGPEARHRCQRLRRDERRADLYNALAGTGPAAVERHAAPHTGDQEDYPIGVDRRGRPGCPGSAPPGNGARREQLLAGTNPARPARGGGLTRPDRRGRLPTPLPGIAALSWDGPPACREAI